MVVLVLGTEAQVQAAKFLGVSVLDQDYLVVNISDGDVAHPETTQDVVTRYTPELDVTAAAQTANWTLKSSQDSAYGSAGKHPAACYRKTKLSGHGQMEWDNEHQRLPLRIHLPALDLPQATELDAAGHDLHA